VVGDVGNTKIVQSLDEYLPVLVKMLNLFLTSSFSLRIRGFVV
jgi:hypothetical protein